MRKNYVSSGATTTAPPSAGASLYEKIRYFLQVHLTPELTQHQIPQEYLDAWYIEDIDAYTDYIQRHDMEADNERTLPFRVFMEAQAGHDDYYSILRDEEDYRTPGPLLTVNFFRFQYLLRLLREARQQGVALPMLRTPEPYALRLGIEPETVEEMRDLANYFIAESIDGNTEKKLC